MRRSILRMPFAQARKWIGWARVLALAPAIAAAVCGGCKQSSGPATPPPPEVLVTDVVQKDVAVYGEWIGTLSGYINATIRPQVKGYLLTKNYKEGDVVHSGDLLFQIDPREFQAQLDQAQGQLARAQAAQVKTQQDVTRYTPLAKEGAVSQQELDNAIQANLAAKAQVDSARATVDQAKLSLSWTKVTSPIDGVSGIAIAQIGDLVEPATDLTTVSQLDPIKVVVPVSEQQYLSFAKARAKEEADRAPRKGALDLVLADGSVFPQRGTVSVVGRQVDPRTGTLTIEGQFPNPSNILRPGGYAKVRAVIDNLAHALVVPQAAVQNFQGTTQVAVVTTENKVEIRNVTTGPRSGFDWAILDGVKPGERVIVEGLQKVRGGITVAPKPFIAPKPAPTPTAAPF
jgi:membrane fusion protein (multidrug efflux system)